MHGRIPERGQVLFHHRAELRLRTIGVLLLELLGGVADDLVVVDVGCNARIISRPAGTPPRRATNRTATRRGTGAVSRRRVPR
jgi:hypothetical protein